MKKFKRRIPIKNYIYSIIILVGVILLILYIFSWYNVKKEEKLMKSYLISSKTIESKIDNLQDLEQTLSEAPLSYFVIFSYTGNEDVYNMERSLKRVIDRYKLNDSIYYVDASKNLNNKEYINNLNKMFKTKNVKYLPVIIYVEEGKAKEVLNNITSDSFKELLERNNFKIVK